MPGSVVTSTPISIFGLRPSLGRTAHTIIRTMSFEPFLRLLRDGRLVPLLGVGADLKAFYRLTYLAAAGEAGLLERLAAGPATLDSLAEFCAAAGQGREALEAWLQMGIRLRLLRLGPAGYRLRGRASALARPENDSTLAMVPGRRSTLQAHLRDAPQAAQRRALEPCRSGRRADCPLLSCARGLSGGGDSAYLSEERRSASARDRWGSGSTCDMPR